jgi:uncharacterized protein (TIGR00255 family)
MIQSMTGYGAADGPFGGGRVAVELRTVNHRFFNPSLKLPSRLQRWEPELREALRRRIARGHVTLVARVEVAGGAGATVDEARAAAYVAQLRGLHERLGLDGGVDLATILRLPEVLRPAGGEDEAAVEGAVDELLAVVERALDELAAMRRAEGARLADELRERVSVMEAAMARIAERAPGRLAEQRDRLRAAVRELTEGVAVDEQRIAQEVAILADRLDVQEEVARFGSHVSAFRSTLETGAADGVGKRLGFLVQELLREANTTGSKANDATIVQNVLLLKEELERIREQVENLE